jgi:hypothetical protein
LPLLMCIRSLRSDGRGGKGVRLWNVGKLNGHNR